MVPLGAYLPDQPALGQNATVANNCVPAVGYYAPLYIRSVPTPSNFFNDKIFAMLWTKDDAGTAGERSDLLRWLASQF